MRESDRAKRSQIDSPRPSSSVAPSIWYADVATPQTNPLGNETVFAMCAPISGGVGAGAAHKYGAPGGRNAHHHMVALMPKTSASGGYPVKGAPAVVGGVP